MNPIKITNIITGLTAGGAETALYRLLSEIRTNEEFDADVICLSNAGVMGEKIESLGFTVRYLNLNPAFPSFLKLRKLFEGIRASQPHIVQTWMYHSDFLGGIASTILKKKVVWGIRHSNLSLQKNKWKTLLIAKLCAALSSRIPIRIVCNSRESLKKHIQFGYSQEKMTVIPNGFDLEAFTPISEECKNDFRFELGLTEQSILIGLIARFDIQKDHQNFVSAAGKLGQYDSNIHFVMCGDGITQSNHELMDFIKVADLEKRCHLLGPRNDIPRITASLDIAVSSSCGESFPNVVGEAMSCSVPCIVTDVGDSASIVGDTGYVVPPSNSEALFLAVKEMIDIGYDERKNLGSLARKRIGKEYSIKRISELYYDLYKSIVTSHIATISEC